MMVAEIADFVVLFGVIALMGRMGDQALYIRSAYLPIAFLFLGFSSAFDISSQVSASVNCGRDRPQDVPVIALSMARVWILGGAAVCLLILLGAPGLASLLHVTPAVRGEFVAFVRWTSLAELTVIGPVLCAASLRGFGYAREAAAVTLTSAAVYLGGVALLGLGTGMGAFSVPVSAVASDAVGLFIGLVLGRRRGLLRPDRLRWEGQAVGHLIRVGIPVALSFFVIATYDLVICWVLAPFGASSVAGFSTAFTVQGLVITPGIVLGSATAIVMNQQRGAGGLHAQLSRTLSAGFQVATPLYVALSVLTWLGAGPIGHVITNNPAIASDATDYLSLVGLTFLIQGPVLLALTVMEQTGGGFLAVALNIIYFLAIAVIGGTLARSMGSTGDLYRTIAIANLAGICVPVVAVTFVRRLAAGIADPVPG
ncbi:MAG TPA: MATE family efflux transporter [Streptosporangiaceae bacterium]